VSDAELRRLREDLDTMLQAAGMGLPFEWPDVWEALCLVPAGGFLVAWAFLRPADWLLLGLVPLLLLALAAGAVTLVPYALVAPLCGSQRQAIAVGGLAVMLAGLLAAAIMAWQVRGSRGSHESATH
jgi:hypothetical protein